MKIVVTDLSVTQIAEPSIIIRGGVVVYSLNFTPEYNEPSNEESFGDFDPDYADLRERFETLEDCNE